MLVEPRMLLFLHLCSYPYVISRQQKIYALLRNITCFDSSGEDHKINKSELTAVFSGGSTSSAIFSGGPYTAGWRHDYMDYDNPADSEHGVKIPVP